MENSIIMKISWDKYETALLIDTYWNIKRGIITPKEAIKDLSKNLRKRAINEGNCIDDIFRNENGIKLRLAEIETIFTNGDKGLNKKPSKLFKEIADLYISDFKKYENLLEEALSLKIVDPNENIKNMFFDWSINNIPASERCFLEESIGIIDEFCVKTKIYDNTLLEVTDLTIVNIVKESIERNKIFKYRYKKHKRKCISTISYYSQFLKGEYIKTKYNKTPIQIDRERKDIEYEKGENIVDFKSSNNYFQTIPVSFKYFGENIFLEKQSWSYLYGKLAKIIYQDNPNKLKALIGIKLANCGKIDFYENNSDKITLPVEIEQNLYLETFASSNDIIRKIRALLDECLVDYENVLITYFHQTIESIVKIQDISKKQSNNEQKIVGEINSYVVDNEGEDPVNKKIDNTLYKIDFENLPDLSYTFPVLLTFKDSYSITNPSSWTDLYVNVVTHLYRLAPKTLQKFAGKNINNGSRADFGYKYMASNMKAPKPVNNYFFVETNLNSIDIVKKIKTLLELCHINHNDVTIQYSKKSTATINKDQVPSISKNEYIEEFKHWMIKQHISPNTAVSYASAISVCEGFMLKKSIGTCKLINANKKEITKNIELLKNDDEFIKNNDSQHNRLTAALSKFMKFSNICIDVKPTKTNKTEHSIKREDFKQKFDDKTIVQYSKILTEKFAKGYRFDIMSRKQFARAYYKEFKEEIINLEEIDDIIKSICFVCNNRAYHPKAVLDPTLSEKIINHIKSELDTESSVTYIGPLYDFFEEELLYSGISSADMLEAYLKHISNNSFYVDDGYITKSRNYVPSVRDKVCEYMRTSGPQTFDDLCQKFYNFPSNKIKNAISNDNRIIYIDKQTYCHAEFFNFEEDTLEKISDIISNSITQNGYMSARELWKNIKVKLPRVFEENEALTTEYGLRNVLKWYLKGKFNFDTIISSKTNVYSLKRVFEEFCESRHIFTINDLEDLAKGLNSVIYFDNVYDKSFRINENQFITDNELIFDTARIDASIESFISDEYITINDIHMFGTFPETNFPWNNYLLESYVSKYSQKLKLFHERFNAKVTIGAIVKKSANFNSYHEIIVDALAKSNIELKKDSAFDYLCMRGFLSCRQYKKIDEAIEKAQTLRKNVIRG